MFRLIGVIVVALLVVGVIGWHEGWIRVYRYSTPTEERVRVKVDRDPVPVPTPVVPEHEVVPEYR